MSKVEWERITKVQNDPFTQYSAGQGILKYWKKLTHLNFNYYFKEADYVIYYKKECRKRLQERLFKNQKLVHKYLDLIEKEHNRYVFESEKNKNIDFSILPDEELRGSFQKFVDNHYRIMGIISLPFDLEFTLNYKISSVLQKNKNKEAILQILSAPDEPSSTLLEKIDLLKLAIQIKNLFPDQIRKKIQEHQRKYSWLGMLALRGNPYSFKFYEDRLKEELMGNPQEKYFLLTEKQKKQENDIKHLLSEIGANKEFKKMVTELRHLVFLRTWRLEQISKGCSFSISLLKEIAQRKSIPIEDLIFLLPPEIDALLKGKQIKKDIINQRKQMWGIDFDDDRINFLQGEEVRIFAEDLAEHFEFSLIIKGQCASPGNHVGKAVIVKNKKDLGKVQKGDIMITEMTTPDFVPAMERAGAIVTDIGGLTCHAAIVAREMNKPCVVGTEKATKIIKTGDKIEVNASRGEITILNH